jgi:putative oxidoreductase
MSLFTRIQDLVAAISRPLASLPPTVARLFLGVAFMGTGWGKLHNLDGLIGYFTQLHIPAPAIQAPFIAGLEFFGGIFLLLGLGTRLVSLLLACTMIVAILTAKMADVHAAGDLVDLAGSIECLFLALFLWLAVAGPGALSLDRLIVKATQRRQDVYA